MPNKRVARAAPMIVCLAVGTVASFILTGWLEFATVAADSPGVELGPDHVRQANPGQTIKYDHTLTNTGATTDTFVLEVSSTQGWPLELLGGEYPNGTARLPLRVGPQMQASLQVSLTVPLYAAGVTEITLVTATSQSSPTVRGVATDTTIVFHRIRLPLVLKRWPPIPYPPTLHPISNDDNDGSYTVAWTEQPSRLADTYTLEEAAGSAFTTGLRMVCTTTQQSCAVSERLDGTYHYRVRGHNTWGYGAWSNIQAVTVALPTPPSNRPPSVPSDPSPAHHSTVYSLVNFILEWTGGDPDGDSVTYDVYFEAGDTTPDVLICHDVTSASCEPPDTWNDVTYYYWQVVARDEHGAVTVGPIWRFLVCLPPP